MLYQYSYRLGAYAPGLDPDAKAYIAAVETALSSSISADQKNAINTFFKTGKSDGWYSSLKRLYLPIWADAAANALCMVSRTSGTFAIPSGIDQTNLGYIETVAPTGHFLADATPASLGLTPNNAMIFSASYEGEQDFMGCGGASNSRLLVGRVGATRRTSMPSTSTIVGSGSDSLGILLGSRVDDDLALYQRKSSGWITPETTTNVDVTALPAFAPAFLGNINSSGIVSIGRTSTAKFISYGYGLGLSSTEAESFTLALKDLWEIASGLTLP